MVNQIPTRASDIELGEPELPDFGDNQGSLGEEEGPVELAEAKEEAEEKVEAKEPEMVVAIPSAFGAKTEFRVGRRIDLTSFIRNPKSRYGGEIVDMEIGDGIVDFKLDTGRVLQFHGEFVVIKQGQAPEEDK